MEVGEVKETESGSKEQDRESSKAVQRREAVEGAPWADPLLGVR
jgi:hypothetical protein